MNRDYGKEIDAINEQLNEIKQLLTAFTQQPQPKKGTARPPMQKVEPMENMHPDPRLSEIMMELCIEADSKNDTGYITYLGVFASGDNQSNWISQTNVNGLLKLIESNMAAKVLACIGNNDRLNLLLAILRTPRTVAQLVEDCGYNTTGQVYHHLKPLLAADLITEDENNRGIYKVKGHRVQGIIMLLAGISDMIDPKYSQGNWE